MRFLQVLSVALSASLCSFFTFSAPANFDAAKKIAGRIYAPEPTEFYCDCPIRWQSGKGTPNLTECGYKVRKNGPRASRIEWEHVMPAQQFGSHLACWKNGGRKECGSDDVLFKKMEADLFNLKPAIGEVNGDRAHYRFAMLPKASSPYGACEMKIDFKARLVEPREAIRGDIARIHFYMSDKYNLPLSKAQQQLFMAWHKADPVDAKERALQARIAQQMGHSNEFVTGRKTWDLHYKPTGFGVSPSANPPTQTAATTSKGSEKASQAWAVRGNKNSRLYHLSHCSGFSRISERNQVEFSTENAAIAAGYSLAGNCKANAS